VVAVVGDDGDRRASTGRRGKTPVGSGYHLVGVTLAAGAQAPIGFAISTPVGASPMSSTAGVAVPTARRV
jgi:hypothetical protein